jgi:ABC-type arginine transport system permease subunit
MTGSSATTQFPSRVVVPLVWLLAINPHYTNNWFRKLSDSSPIMAFSVVDYFRYARHSGTTVKAQAISVRAVSSASYRGGTTLID